MQINTLYMLSIKCLPFPFYERNILYPPELFIRNRSI